MTDASTYTHCPFCRTGVPHRWLCACVFRCAAAECQGDPAPEVVAVATDDAERVAGLLVAYLVTDATRQKILRELAGETNATVPELTDGALRALVTRRFPDVLGAIDLACSAELAAVSKRLQAVDTLKAIRTELISESDR